MGLRDLMSRLPTGVTVVCARVGEDIQGLTVGAFCSLSLDPPLVLICVRKAGSSHDFIERAGSFAVSILGEGQEWLASRFADDTVAPPERLDGVEYVSRATGAPVLTDAVGWVDCELVAIHPGGDHSIFVGAIHTGAYDPDRAPLVFFDRRYLALGQAEPTA